LPLKSERPANIVVTAERVGYDKTMKILHALAALECKRTLRKEIRSGAGRENRRGGQKHLSKSSTPVAKGQVLARPVPKFRLY